MKDLAAPLNAAKIVNKDGKPAYSVDVAGANQVLTAEEVTLKFLSSLYRSAVNYIGKPVEQAVFSVPADFTQEQCEALQNVSKQAKVEVLQIIPAAGAACMTYGITDAPSPQLPSAVSRDIVVVDVGGSSTTASVLSVRDGLLNLRAKSTARNVGGDEFDAKLVDFFSKEFTKKTKTPWDPQDHKAVSKLTLEVEGTKRTLSASTAGPCSVESLAQGLDFSGTVNRTRFDLISSPVYSKIVAQITEALKQASIDPVQIQEVVLVGASCRLPSLANRVADVFPDSTKLTNTLDPDEIVAMGCALQAQLLSHQKHSSEVSVSQQNEVAKSVPALSKPIGLLLGPSKDSSKFAVLLDTHTPLPARKMLEVNAPKNASEVALSLYEGEHSIHVEQPPAKESNGGDEDSEDDFEEEPTKTAVCQATSPLAALAVSVKPSADGESEQNQRINITLTVGVDGKGSIVAQQAADGAQQFKASF